MLHNNGILFNVVLRPKLLNNPFATCSFISIDFLLLHTTHFYNKTVLPFLDFKTFELTFSAFLLYFKQYVDMFYNVWYMKILGLILFQPLFSQCFFTKTLISIP